MRPALRQIADVFIRYANITFGGGSATIAVLHREIVERRGWLDQPQFGLCYGLSRLTPGTNLLAFCTAAGWLVRGWAGAVIALLAASIPCSLIVVLVTFFFERAAENLILKMAVAGAMAAAVGITVSTCWTIAKPYVTRTRWLRAVIIVGVAVLLEAVFAVPPVRVLLLAAVIGCVLPVDKA